MSVNNDQIGNLSKDAFRAKYGPWALILGASHGVGAAFAREVASAGINCILLSRRAPALEKLKGELEAEYGIDTQVITMDLSAEKVGSALASAVGDKEVGLLIYNAGAPADAQEFLKVPIEEWSALVRQNAQALIECCHVFGKGMVDRGRGGVILVGSQAALGGNRKYSLYTATKGFMANFGESLWAEWSGKGVDVLNLLIQVVDTPTLREQMRRSNIPGADKDDIGVPKPEEMVEISFRELSNGPTFIHPDDVNAPAGTLSKGAQRKEDLVERVRITSAFIGED